MKNEKIQSDYDVLKEHHRFIHSETEEETHSITWESELATKYDKKLRKDFAISDLSQSKKGKLGLRWRTGQEVISGKGDKICGDKNCTSTRQLGKFEVYFKYSEAGKKKDVLVTVVLCNECAKKLNDYKRRQAKHDTKDIAPEEKRTQAAETVLEQATAKRCRENRCQNRSESSKTSDSYSPATARPVEGGLAKRCRRI